MSDVEVRPGLVHNDLLPPEQKLMMARTRLIARAPFYGHLSMMIDWVRVPPDHQCKTMGVRIKEDRRVECVWNPDFIASQTMHQVIGAIMHELEHIVHLHMARCGSRDSKTWNIAADMTVNGTEAEPLIGYDSGAGNKVLPLDGKIIFRPKDWQEATSEALYEKVKAMKRKPVCPVCQGAGKLDRKQHPKKNSGNPVPDPDGLPEGSQGQSPHGGNEETDGDCKYQGDQGGGEPDAGGLPGDGKSDGGDETGDCPSCGGEGEMTPFDDHSMWNSPLSQEEARQIVEEIVKDAVAKARGNVPGHLAEAIEALGKPHVPWYHLLRRYLGRSVRGCRETWSRVKRRRDEFGVKGDSRHAVGKAVVIIDTSGSISDEDLKQFWGEIESMMSRVTVSVLQWDHQFQGWWPKYRKGDWKKIKVCGRGGTDMVAPIDWLIEQGQVPARGPVIMLTDGMCTYHEPCTFPFICVVTTKEGSVPNWGEVVRLVKE